MVMTSDRGTISLHAAFMLVFLVGLSAFVIDQGLLLVARAEAQTAADAGAVAGAAARAYLRDTKQVSAAQAITIAQANDVWFEPPSISTGDVTIATCVNPEAWWPVGDECVTASVYRTSSRGNALPTVFAQFLGIADQNVSATAVARVASANVTECLRPFAIPDKWAENSDCEGDPTGVWSEDSTFDTKYCKGPLKGQPLPRPDVYVPPTRYSPGTGFTTADYGAHLVLKSSSAISGSWFGALKLPRGGQVSNGSPAYIENIESCTGDFTSYGAQFDMLPGNRVGPTQHGVSTLINGDPSAYWDASTQRIRGGCMADGTCAKSSRLIAVGVFDMNDFADGNDPGAVTVRNIVGFFIEGFDGNDLMGYLTYYPGVLNREPPAVTGASSFLKAAVLAR
jgi:putative Flp pilus-assembly TadE/G-like protein